MRPLLEGGEVKVRSIAVVMIMVMVPFMGLFIPGQMNVESLRYGPNDDISKVDASFIGKAVNEGAGDSIEVLGDVNGDGIDDFIIGATGSNDGGLAAGKAFLFLGKETGWNTDTNVDNADASFMGESWADNAGSCVGRAGDVNGDGYNDILIGAHSSGEHITTGGQVYLIFGKGQGWATNVTLNQADASFFGSGKGDYLGALCKGAGDVNGDGFDDFLLSSPQNDDAGPDHGKTYLVFGKESGWSMDVNISLADASFVGENASDHAGTLITGGGDINADGYDDFLIGAPSLTTWAGEKSRVYIMFGKPSGWSKDMNLSQADASIMGWSKFTVGRTGLAGLDDVNDDGFDDFMIGGTYDIIGASASTGSRLSFGQGFAYVFLGNDSDWGMDINVTTADASIWGDASDMSSGWVVAAMAGDVNGDGYNEMLYGDYDMGPTGTAYMVLGGPSVWQQDMDVRVGGAYFTGEATGDDLGVALAGGGDVNGDGFDDILFSAPMYSNSFSYQGKVYLLFPELGTRPSSVSSIKACSDPACTNEAYWANFGDTVHVEMTGTDANASRADVALVKVNCSAVAPVGFTLKLYETGVDTGVFKGEFTVSNRTRTMAGFIKAQVNETIFITSKKDPSVNTTVFVTAPEIRMLPYFDNRSAVEDHPYFVHYFGVGKNPALAWTFDTNATWLQWDVLKQDLSGTPNNTHVGQYFVSINVTDGLGHHDDRNFTLRVVNTPPKIMTADINTTLQNGNYSVDYNSSDDGQGIVTWHLSTNATWLSINSTSGVLAGTTNNSHIGTFLVNVSVDDGNGGWDFTLFNLTVEDVNDPPKITTLDVNVTWEDKRYDVVYEAYDVDVGDNVNWSFMSNASHWLTFDPMTGSLAGTPTNFHIGWYWVNVTAYDDNGGSDIHNFTLTVLNVNDAPIITSIPVTTAQALYYYTYDVEVLDIDLGDQLTFSLARAPPEMMIEDVTGIVRWVPRKEDVGSHDVSVAVSDMSATTTQDFSITVTLPRYYRPRATLLTPTNSSTVDVTNPVFTWSIDDPDSTMVHSDLYMSKVLADVDALDVKALLKADIPFNAYRPTVPLSPGATYYWTVLPNDGEHDGSSLNGIWSFSIDPGATISTRPVTALVAPSNGTLRGSHPVALSWTVFDPDSDSITYDVYFGDDVDLVTGKDVSTLVSDDIAMTELIMKDLTPGTTYYWTVIPDDDQEEGFCANGVWGFLLLQSATENKEPTITTDPVTTAYVDTEYRYQVGATDPESGGISYMLVSGPNGMVIDPVNGTVIWTPTADQLGNHTVEIRASDGFLWSEQTFVVEVRPTPPSNELPVAEPVPDTEVKVGTELVIDIIATDPEGESLAYILSDKPHGMEIDEATGRITWTPTTDQVGEHSVQVTVHDGENYIYVRFNVKVEKAGPPSNPILSGLGGFLPLLLILMIMILAVAAVLIMRRRRTDAGTAGTEAPPSPDTMAPAGASVEAPMPWSDADPVTDEIVEEFDIREAFLLYNDGRVITHTRADGTVGEDKDADIMGGMIVAVQEFVMASFKSDNALDSFTFGDQKISFVKGNHLILAYVVEGPEPAVLREDIHSLVQKIEGLYAGHVEDWDGDLGLFKDVTPYLMPLFEVRSKYRMKIKERTVKLKSGVEFYRGFVRLKIGVGNELDTIISDITLTLDYDHKSLRLSHIEPDYPISDGTTIFLTDIYPREKRSVAVYFDPVMCQESHVDGWVTYVDAERNPGEARMKRRPVDIVCPIFYTTETVNVAMLKRLLDEIQYTDARIYSVKDLDSLKNVYRLAVNNVKGHDVKVVREFSEEIPYEAETWFFGDVKETDEKIVIRVAARDKEEFQFLEVFIASSNLANLTGLLAELGKEFRESLDMKGIRDVEVLTSTDDDLKEELERTALLLNRMTEEE